MLFKSYNSIRAKHCYRSAFERLRFPAKHFDRSIGLLFTFELSLDDYVILNDEIKRRHEFGWLDPCVGVGFSIV